jgi:ketosteroid isomerase-like protein
VGQSFSDPGERMTAVEIVRGQIEAYRSRDTALAISFFDPYAVWDASRIGGLDAGNVAYRTDEMNDIVGRYRSAFDDYDFEVQRLADLGSGAVLAVVTETGFGKTSGAPVKRHFAIIYTVIERKIVRMSVFPTERAALEAVEIDANP